MTEKLDTGDFETLDASELQVSFSGGWPGVSITDPVERRLFARRIAVKVISAIREAGVSTVVVTSPDIGAGKTFLTRLIAPEFEHIEPGRYLVVPHQKLEGLRPHLRDENLVVIIDGPAMLDGDGFLDLPDEWVHAFDSALLVVMGRKTDRDRLAECVKWLDAANIKPIGTVYNELICPEPSWRVRQLAAWVKGPLRERFLGKRSAGDP